MSLLELVVVLAILAATVALAASTFRASARPVPLQPLAIRMAADLRMARATAIAQNRPVKVTVDTPARSYLLETALQAVVLPPKVGLSVADATASQVSGDSIVVVFYPDGSSTGGGFLLTDQRRAVKVAIDALTGAVTTENANR